MNRLQAQDVRLDVDTRLIEALDGMSNQTDLNLDRIIRIALVASGTPDELIPSFTEDLEDHLTTLPEPSGSGEVDGEEVLRWMHQRILTRYSEPQTRLDILLDSGVYNCVSSAVLYMIAARYQNLNVQGVVTPDHAFCVLELDDQSFDVETTTAYGFDPGSRKEAQDAFSGKTGFAYVPPSNYRIRHTINDRELLSLIYQNRIASLQGQRRWTEAVGLAVDRFALADSPATREDFLDSASNYVAVLDREERSLEALDFLLSASDRFDDPRWTSLADIVVNNAVVRMVRLGDDHEALGILEHPGALLAGEDVLADHRRSILQRQVEITVRSSEHDEALTAANQALERGVINSERWEEFVLYLYSREANRRASGQQWPEAYDYLLSLPLEVREISQFRSLLSDYAHNAAATWHNRFATAWRRQDYDAAQAAVTEGLASFPEDPTLLHDASVLNDR